MADTASVTTARTPVVVFTGFLGSGKTTLLNQVLAQNADQPSPRGDRERVRYDQH